MLIYIRLLEVLNVLVSEGEHLIKMIFQNSSIDFFFLIQFKHWLGKKYPENVIHTLIQQKVFKCVSVERLLYSDSFSAIATIPSLNMLELFPACFPCCNNFNLSQSW